MVGLGWRTVGVDQGAVDVAGDLLNYLSENPNLAVVAKEADATVNQVVLAWLMGGALRIIPLVGASSVAQVNESLAAVDLTLTADQRAQLDSAH